MAAKQIEGSSAKPSFLSRVGTSFSSTVRSNFRPGAGIYSLTYGVAGGLVLSGLVYVGRTLNILLFDHEYYKLQSRKRFFEKQLLFSREQEETASAHYLASLAGEYDPVATRLPFKPLDAKYRF
mmetsp:Transcript_128306/g.256259  ORF Transcript_128306/g.256259 Transcript_128306/m.256259 type:complete len:124 (-) Transcript_128306:35-406(-)